jgi:DNA segregation ATPase FtsK/SpoIIIE-like protein
VLGVEDVRIGESLIKYEGESYLPIDVRREKKKALLLTNEVIKSLGEFELPIGLDNFGQLIKWDTGSGATAHFMISGAAGSGKSYAITSMMLAALK